MKNFTAWSARIIVMVMVLIFWQASLQGLDRFPPLHNDESTILAPGLKLFTHGVFGLDMYTGFYQQEQIYLEIPPLMSWLQGLSVTLLGVGVWQMRFLPVVLGALTIALTFAVGRRLAHPAVGMLAAAFLLVWQWTPPGLPFLGSGIPLIDVSRLARYDILVAPLGLGAFWAWIQARQTSLARYDFLSGLLVGLAGLANVYGAFWLPALLLLNALTRPPGTPGPSRVRSEHAHVRIASIGWLALGAGLPWLGWGTVAVTHWSSLTGQFVKHATDGRLDLLSPMFYLNNLLNEIHRYQLGARDPATFGRLGFWLLVVGVPLGMLWLIWRVRRGNQRALWLLVPALTIPFLLGLLINLKRFYYLIAVVPLFAIVLAWACVGLWQRSNRSRTLAALGLIVMVGQGAFGILLLQQTANQVEAPEQFYLELQALVPPALTRIYGPHEYWFAFYDREYRGFVLPLLLSRAQSSSFGTAMQEIAPQVVLLNPYLTDVLARMDRCGEPPSCADQFWQFMAAHQATLLAEVQDYQGQPVQIYLLEW